MYYVYFIQSAKNNTYYVGYTKDLKKRLAQHSSGKVRSTRPHTPYKLVYYEAYIDESTAKKREKEIKKRRIAKEEIINRIKH